MNSQKKNKLIWKAVPTIFNVPNPPKLLQGKRPPPPERQPIFSNAKRSKIQINPKRVTTDDSVSTKLNIASVDDENMSSSSLIDTCFNAVNMITSSTQTDRISFSSCPAAHTITKAYVQMMKLKKKIKSLQQLLKQANTRNCRLHKRLRKQQLKNESTGKSNCICEQLNNLPKTQKFFLESQLRAASVSKLAMRWTESDKMLSLALFYKSPAAFRFMQKSFRLPSITTLHVFISQFEIHPGFSTGYINCLRERVMAQPVEERHAVLLFDGLSIKSFLKYSEHEDAIKGYVDYGGCVKYGRTGEVANHALQFMVRGVGQRWKQPLGHFFTAGPVPYFVIAKLVVAAIKVAEEAGLIIVSIVCDQETAHQKALKDLKMTEEKTWFLSSSGRKVYAMHDTPHLIKNLRNNLMNYNIHTEDGVVYWKHLVELYELEKKEPLRAATKLTNDHLNPAMFKKMRVCLATELLSQSVAVAMRTYVAFGQMPVEALVTANFIEKINRLFDVMNSQKISEQNKYKKPLRLTSVDQLAVLDSSLDWMKDWKFVGNEMGNRKQTLPFRDGWILTIQSLKSVVMDLLTNFSYKFILTSRFNQDALENFFCQVRSKGGSRDNPSTLEYEAACKNISVNWLLERPEKGGNCDIDCDEFIGMISSGHKKQRPPTAMNIVSRTSNKLNVASLPDSQATLSANESQATLSANESQATLSANESQATLDANETLDTQDTTDGEKSRDDLLEEIIKDNSDAVPEVAAEETVCTELEEWEESYGLSDVQNNILCYIAGYIAKKLTSFLKCDICNDLQASFGNNTNIPARTFPSEQTFLGLKTFEWAKKGLYIPSPQLFELCKQMEHNFREDIELLSTTPKLMETLMKNSNIDVNSSSVKIHTACNDHQESALRYCQKLFFRVRLHSFCTARK